MYLDLRFDGEVFPEMKKIINISLVEYPKDLIIIETQVV